MLTINLSKFKIPEGSTGFLLNSNYVWRKCLECGKEWSMSMDEPHSEWLKKHQACKKG